MARSEHEHTFKNKQNRKPKHMLRLKWSPTSWSRRSQYFAMGVFLVAFGALGVYLFGFSHAATTIDPNTWAPTGAGTYFFDRSNQTGNAQVDFAKRESQVGRKFDGHMYYEENCDVTPSALADPHWSLSTDHVPFVVLSWCGGNNPNSIIPDIAAGKYDKDINDFANSVKSQLTPYGHVFIRPFWEFNYTGTEWNDTHYGNNPQPFIQAWQHLVTLFRQDGLSDSQVKFIWCPNRASSQSQDPTPYYPGSSYVDWIGIDAYPKNQFLTLQQLVTTSASGSNFDWYDTFKSYGKPLMVGETGIQPASAYGSGSLTRATWWSDALSELKGPLSQIRAIEYFDANQGINWMYDASGPSNDSSSQALAAAASTANNCYMNVLSSQCGGSGSGSGGGGGNTGGGSGGSSGGGGTGGIPRFSHVVLVMEENHGFNQIIGDTTDLPYINSLASGGALFTNSHGVAHPSFPNYLALFSGSQQGTTKDTCPPPGSPYSAANLGSELLSAHLTFGAYAESLPSNIGNCGPSPYAGRHVPSVWFSNVPASTAHDFSTFPTTAAGFASLPTLSFVTPALPHDMHSYGTETLAQRMSNGDSWLKANLSAYANWAKSNNSLLILQWDEDEGTTGNSIPTVFYGANVKPGRYSENITHYTVLRTLEDMYGLPGLGGAASQHAITDVWSAATGSGSGGQGGSGSGGSQSGSHSQSGSQSGSRGGGRTYRSGSAVYTISSTRGGMPVVTIGPSGGPGGGGDNGSGVENSAGGGGGLVGQGASGTPAGLKITGPVLLQATPNADVVKVQYYLNNKLLETVTTPPFGYTFNPRDILNGKYKLTVREYLNSGKTEDTTLPVIIANPFSFTQARLAAAHYATSGPGIAAIVILAMLAVFIIVRRKLLARRNETPPIDTDFFGTQGGVRQPPSSNTMVG